MQVTITDNDLIEKSNLNRQFLFRPQHIQVSAFSIEYRVQSTIIQYRVQSTEYNKYSAECFVWVGF